MSEAEQPLIGKQLNQGRYRLDTILGEGGMGSVYLAHQSSMERQVAIKIIHPRLLLDRTLVQRFHQEAKNLAKLRSPHCVTVHDFGETDEGLLYLVMELLGGHSLDKELQASGPLAVDRLIAYMEQICRGLGAAHQLGMVHRDLKPANINVEITSTGSPLLKVLDFGLSKIVLGDGAHQKVDLTKTGQVFGTPRYMSPEQCSGKRLDMRTDIYSLGLIAFEALTGQPVYAGKTVVELLVAHSTLPPPDLQAIRSDLPKHVADTIYMAIAKKPEHRWRSVEDFMAGLKGEISGSVPKRDYSDLSEPNTTLQVADTKPVVLPSDAPAQMPQRKPIVFGVAMVFLGIVAGLLMTQLNPSSPRLFAADCNANPSPAFDSKGQACLDKHTMAYWAFEENLLGQAPDEIPPYQPDLENSFKEPSKHLVPGVFGKAVKFSGTRESRLVMNRTVVLGDHFTIEAWVKPSLEPENFCHQLVVGTLDLGSSRACDLSRTRAGWALMIDRNQASSFDVEFHFVSDHSQDGKPGSITRVALAGPHPIRPNKWNHIAITSDGTQVQISVNGRAQTHVRNPRILSKNSRWLHFSGFPGRIDGDFAGELDGVRISSVARTNEELLESYEQAKR